jgi:hypothetical protein
MYRLGALLVVVVACGGSGFDTGPATMSGIVPMIQSAGANSFTQADGSGNMVLGWKIEMFSNGSGYDCLSNNADEEADLFVFTPQAPSGNMKATLAIGDVSIVPDNPPTINGVIEAHFATNNVHQINGDLDITTVHMSNSTSIDRIEGTVSAAGTGSDGADISIAGTFVAPVCE